MLKVQCSSYAEVDSVGFEPELQAQKDRILNLELENPAQKFILRAIVPSNSVTKLYLSQSPVSTMKYGIDSKAPLVYC